MPLKLLNEYDLPRGQTGISSFSMNMTGSMPKVVKTSMSAGRGKRSKVQKQQNETFERARSPSFPVQNNLNESARIYQQQENSQKSLKSYNSGALNSSKPVKINKNFIKKFKE